jgi:hypothetical protein
MAGILKTIWLDLKFCLRAITRRPKPFHSGFPVFNAGPRPSDNSAAPAKHFYSLIIEVRPDDASAETLQLFLDEARISLSATLNLPISCELRRCTSVSPDFAEILINM